MDGLRFVLLPLGCVGADGLADGHGVGEHTRPQPLQAVRHLVHAGVRLAGELPPGQELRKVG